MAKPANANDMRLMAKDADDLAIIAACLQDALVPISEVQYLSTEQRFIMLLNRFRWERQPAGRHAPTAPAKADASFHDADDYYDTEQRIHCGLCADKVTAVRSRGVDLKQRGKFLSLLTLQVDGTHLNLLFSGGGVIQLTISELSVFLKDMGEGWPTQWRPDHEREGAGTKGRE
ncbi:DUF2948 family protein [Dongia sp.]|uniref:DUF2948 family protein n=1 Tax=Dongia sp. TaxID=1977262 RepID=UPI0035B45EC5